MKVLRVLAPGVDDARAVELRQAIAVFNRGLDIRLRFLSIGIDEREVRVSDAAEAAEAVALAIEAFSPDAVLLEGGGEAAVAAATAALRLGAMLVRSGAGRREGETADADRALDRIAAVLLTESDEAEKTLAGEGLSERVVRLDMDDRGAAVIRALRQAHIRRAGGG